jgi:hypothetical protein
VVCGGAPAGLDRDNRLRPRCRTSGRHEFGGIGDPFDIHQDRIGLRVGRIKIDQIAKVDVGHVAYRDHARKPNPAISRPVENCGHKSTALRNEGNPTGGRRDMCERSIEPGTGHLQAYAIRSDDAQKMRSGCIEHRLAQPVGFGNPRRNDYRYLSAKRTQLTDRRRHGFGGNGEDRKIRCGRNLTDCWKPVGAFKLHGARINGIDRAIEFARDEV